MMSLLPPSHRPRRVLEPRPLQPRAVATILAATLLTLIMGSLALAQAVPWDIQSDTWVATDALGRSLPGVEPIGGSLVTQWCTSVASWPSQLGWLFAPIVWLIGVPWQDAAAAGSLMGTKTILNEFIAYLNMAALPGDALTERSKLLMVYALCGFANLGSVGMMIATSERPAAIPFRSTMSSVRSCIARSE